DTNVSPFESVLRNLIENAVKHHDRTDGQIVVSCESHDDYYEFSVQDDGPGIPDEFRDKIFEMFIRIQTENRSSGTGMGLALVKRIVEGYGGWIRAEAASGRGTRFRYTWPKEIPIAEEKNANGLDS
ncbi:MAG: HAMP domain-containing sensor histidine kinase, partial [Planctomycetota bacterium]|nr:HAMP domain-containing sensor histidine kinase [Planctomycetota bacterium]